MGVFGLGPVFRNPILGNQMIRRLAASMLFALLGLVSLLIADVASQWLCARLITCPKAINCPIDVCEGDAHLNIMRLAIWIGPSIVFGISALAFSGQRRSLPAWLGLLAALVVAHSLIMTASR